MPEETKPPAQGWTAEDDLVPTPAPKLSFGESILHRVPEEDAALLKKVKHNEATKKNKEQRKLRRLQKLQEDTAKASIKAVTTVVKPLKEPPVKKEGRPTPVRDALEKCIVYAKSEGADKSRLEALIDKAYFLAISTGTLKEVMEMIELLGLRLEPKVTEQAQGPAPPQVFINVQNTRFAVKPELTNGGSAEVIDVTAD